MSVRPSVLSPHFQVHICWQIPWNEWHKNCHARASRWFALSRHRCQQLLLPFHASFRLSVQLSMCLSFGIADRSLGRKSLLFGMLMYPPSVYRHQQVLVPICPSVCLPHIQVLCIFWQNSWKEWHKIWYADISRWLILSRHRYRWVLLSFHVFVRPVNCPWAWVLVLRTNLLAETIYILACWCIQTTYPLFINAYGYWYPSGLGWGIAVAITGRYGELMATHSSLKIEHNFK